ncbi:MAG: hypothetical protein RLZZ338_2651 [Cyanobacteriota bacterium]
MTDINDIPLMFQAQLKDRGKIQYAGDPEPASKWVRQWLKCCPPIPEEDQEDVPIWQRGRVTQSVVKMPRFGKDVQSKEYTFNWRFVTNSGQDEDVIRPVIGAKGLPFYPGSSMKGAFLRCCTDEQAMKYCGGKLSEQDTKPGILRFHGGYPVDMSWGKQECLVDVIHPQEKRQVMDGSTTSANVQISLYKPTLNFGISSTQKLEQKEWNEIWKIWEKSLGLGLGSRVSAGYGYVENIEDQDRVLISVNLRGEGLTSLLLNKTSEFRPNMFKATLRGHTLRLLAGLTDQQTAQRLTKELWGGITEGGDKTKGAIVGLLGIGFTIDSPNNLILGEHKYYPNGGRNPSFMPTYNLKSGKLDILLMKDTLPEEERKLLKKLVTRLIKFTLLLGGFGKSWRRVDHRLFYPSYFNNNDKPMIGCHWQFTEESKDLYVTAATKDLKNISKFLEDTRKVIIDWLQLKGVDTRTYVKDWRESFCSEKVEIWGRIAKDKNDSKAVSWFHEDYSQNRSIKKKSLTGKMGQIGRLWHRMYPRYVQVSEEVKHTGEYVEILTIFPDDSTETKEFLTYLKNRGEFIKLWPKED